MDLFERFLGRRAAGVAGSAPLVANPDIANPLSLQVLFSESVSLDSPGLERAFRTFHPSLVQARCEIYDELGHEGTLFGLVGWGKHVVKIVGFAAPLPSGAVEVCVAPAHYPQELKARARSHRAHVMLYYAGYDPSPFEQYVALATAAGVLGRLGGLVVLNESAHASLPIAVVSGADSGIDAIELLRALPLPYLYCGFVKHEVEGVRGVWMRTYGAPLLGLPDFAAHAAGHHEGQRYFDIFDHVYTYLRKSGARMARGHTMQIGSHEYLRLRAPKLTESFLTRDGELFVMEIIGPDEINR